MIRYISGVLHKKLDKSLVILLPTGLGYEVFISTDAMLRVPNEGDLVTLWTYFVVRENAQELFGFLTIDELRFFELLISISGIGPRNALGILSVAPIETLKKAIGSGDIGYLTKISGIGKKTAEKIVIELRDKLASLGFSESIENLRKDADVIDALQALGYSQIQARDALKAIPDSIENEQDRIKEALKNLS
jgi:Holliday junction DNA helicase RuvA